MIDHPFSSLKAFRDLVDLNFFAKEDRISSDADLHQSNIVSLHQEHGNRAVVVREPSSRTIHADALATDVPGLTLTIRFADCQNIVIVAPEKKVICLVHAGWRGVAANVATSAYKLLRDEWDINPVETFVGLGPSLCTECAGFTDPAAEVPALTAFIRGKNIDLRGALDAELAAIGIPRSQIERMSGCTRCNPENYWTYRGGDRENVQRGFVNCFAASLS